MRLVLISDIHNQRPMLPDGDCLVAAGDVTHWGSWKELMQFVDWMQSLPYEHKLFISGNHDACLQNIYTNGREQELIRRLSAKDICYLRDSGITLNGLYFYGLPWVPPYAGAWNTEDMKSVCEQIPQEVNVLVTHCPPRGVLDGNMGCPELQAALKRLDDLKLHVFGHCEEFYGQTMINGVMFCNAALSTRRSDPGTRRPLIVDLQAQKCAAPTLR